MTADHLSGHAIARRQITRHGKDRYPSVGAQYAKILEELGELGDALWVDAGQGGELDCEGIRKEYADVGLALFELGNKLHLDLIAEMRDLVDLDRRDFRVPGDPAAATQAYGPTGCT